MPRGMRPVSPVREDNVGIRVAFTLAKGKRRIHKDFTFVMIADAVTDLTIAALLEDLVEKCNDGTIGAKLKQIWDLRTHPTALEIEEILGDNFANYLLETADRDLLSPDPPKAGDGGQ